MGVYMPSPTTKSGDQEASLAFMTMKANEAA